MIVNRLEVPRTMVIRPAVDPTPAQPWDWTGGSERESKKRTPRKHGERRMYVAGCKCPACMEAAAKYIAERRARLGRA